ncbi:hypothetical protein SLEP1_g59229 [Rubroshorea leprosula]|uniref:Reverse transcriptase domain-containing protein n=1 Tax=Rubroshorea leprosula TaxID=152421 RepID=A0AAV5MRR0_9ROSI|nr:hypothetical protein SLEP1_g59229 [Rubroshorea leprosula]
MSEIVSETQSAFVGGRQLIDSVLVLNEVVDEIKNKKQPAFVFKADFEKAYDCVDWSFLDWMMDSFGFGIKWRGWIMECLSTARISILVNGSPTREFEVGKGLRQGDPLSPFLFLMIGEGLQGLVQKAVTEGMLHGIVIGKNGLNVSLLQFADTIFMGRADAENIRMVKDVLRWFEIMSGLRINFNKSSIYGYNVSERWLKGSAGMLRCGVGRAPFLYLGLPIDTKSGSKKVWEPMVKKLRAKLVVWKANTLSFGGRLILLNSGRWVWRVEWRRGTIGREKDEEGVLEKALEGVKLKEGVRDVWKWKHERDGKYVVGAIQSGFFWVAIVLKQASNKGKSSKARGTVAGGRRNAQVFREDEGIPENLLERVQVKTFLWLKAKVNGCVFPFHEWQSCPTECAKAVKRHKRMRKQFSKEAAPQR